MSDQPSLKTMLEILMMLSGINRYTVKEIAEKFCVNERTIYRYLETFREIGFKMIRKNGRYSIGKRDAHFKDLSDLIHFSEEEAIILSKAIHLITDENKYKSDLVEKLYYLFDKNTVANQLITPEHSENAVLIKNAIKQQKQTVFIDYASSNSQSVKDRRVEPFKFTSLYDSVWAYDIEDNTCKTFKIARIRKVNVSDKSFEYKQQHKKKEIDVFRFSGENKIPVSFTMTQLAHNLITEEYPLAHTYIKEQNGQYHFKGWVYNYKGISRFILGLLDDVSDIQPDRLRGYLNKKIAEKIFD